MIRTASNNRNMSLALTITLISLVMIASVLTSGFPQSNFRINTYATINQTPKQPSLPTSITEINETNNLNVANFSNYSSVPLATMPISLETPKSATNIQPDFTQLFFSFPDNTNQGQITELDDALPISVTDINETGSLDAVNSNNNDSSATINTAPSLFDTLNFATYTYGGYSVQQPDPNQFFFSFPDNTNQGQLAGSDALTLDAYAIQKMDFDAAFVAPKISALGFDEMVIFATSDAFTYKGTEFGVRLDLSDGFIYGYIQEPNGNYGDVNFQMLNLLPNDGIIHHYTLIMLGSEVSFYIDGINYGYLNFSSNTDYSSLTFYILAVVHRFTDGWDSVGDNMIVENFLLNQP